MKDVIVTAASNLINAIVSAIFNDIPILSQTSRVDFPFMIVLLVILIVPTFMKQKLYRTQGLLMLLSYITYLVTLYFMYIV